MIKHENETGIALISIVMVYWGITTVLMKHVLYYMNSATYIMLRFTTAAILILLIFGKKLYKNMSRSLLVHSMIMGLIHIIPMECTALALYFTSASNSVFIAQLSFVLVPLMECVRDKRLPGRGLIITMVWLFIGLTVFSNVLVTGINAGDMISVISAVFNAIGILALKKFVREDSPMLLGALQIVFASLFSLVIWEVNPGTVNWCGASIGILILTGAVGTAAAFVILAVGQSKTSSVNASFLTLIQPVCAMIGAYLIADEAGNTEPVTAYKLIGAMIIILALICYLRKNKGIGEYKNERNFSV